MEYIGYLAAIIIGITLGLIGAGGSILTIPVLVYLFGIPAIDATSYSLFIVALSASIGSYRYFNHKLVSFPTIVSFGIPSIISIIISRKYILSGIPQTVANIGTTTVTKNMFLMLLLAVLIVGAAYTMLRKQKTENVNSDSPKAPSNYLMLIIIGICIGLVVGLVGAGGGFLIIPALVLFAKLPMKKAIGTSLVIIALNSSFGFLSDYSHHLFNWNMMLCFSAFAIIGILAGTYLSKNISGEKLKPAFGWFILFIGAFIFAKELF